METILIHIGMIHIISVMDMVPHIIHLVTVTVIHTSAWVIAGADHIIRATHIITARITVPGMTMVMADTILLIIMVGTILLIIIPHITPDIAIIT